MGGSILIIFIKYVAHPIDAILFIEQLQCALINIPTISDGCILFLWLYTPAHTDTHTRTHTHTHTHVV